jgi:hypothetical protein
VLYSLEEKNNKNVEKIIFESIFAELECKLYHQDLDCIQNANADPHCIQYEDPDPATKKVKFR